MTIKPDNAQPRDRFEHLVRQSGADVIEISKRLLKIPSAYPPGDTRAIADEIEALMQGLDGVSISRHRGAEHVMNLVLKVSGGRPGRRLVMNGHLDTFPLGDRAAWTADPAGEQRDGKLFGLGVSDMKGGIATILFAVRQMASCREMWAGELVATLAGDEESMGVLGSKLLLDTVPYARGDVMLSADVGSPRVLRLGEKGMIWLTLTARGRSAHAAHVHKGDSAIDKLMDVMVAIRKLQDISVAAPQEVLDAIDEASAISEQLSGAGESDVLRRVTVTFGTVAGGRLSNLVADRAEATADIRLPVGVSVSQLEVEIERIVNAADGVEVVISRRYEPSWTSPTHEIVGILQRTCLDVLGVQPVVNMRVGASDARHYRAAGIPTVVCGLTPNNMGGADEFVFCEELISLARIFSMTAYSYLSNEC